MNLFTKWKTDSQTYLWWPKGKGRWEEGQIKGLGLTYIYSLEEKL